MHIKRRLLHVILSMGITLQIPSAQANISAQCLSSIPDSEITRQEFAMTVTTAQDIIADFQTKDDLTHTLLSSFCKLATFIEETNTSTIITSGKSAIVLYTLLAAMNETIPHTFTLYHIPADINALLYDKQVLGSDDTEPLSLEEKETLISGVLPMPTIQNENILYIDDFMSNGHKLGKLPNVLRELGCKNLLTGTMAALPTAITNDLDFVGSTEKEQHNFFASAKANLNYVSRKFPRLNDTPADHINLEHIVTAQTPKMRETYTQLLHLLPRYIAAYTMLHPTNEDKETRLIDNSIFDQNFIEQERAITKKTVVFDMDETIVTRNAKGDYVIRPNIADELRTLAADTRLRLILWTNEKRENVETFFAMYPDMKHFFDITLTRENFRSSDFRAHLPVEFDQIASVYQTLANCSREKVIAYYNKTAWTKDLRLLGYDILIEDRAIVRTWATHSPLGKFDYIQVAPWQYIEYTNTCSERENIIGLADTIMRKLFSDDNTLHALYAA